jgi:GT2 family glycosyltransferase
LKTVIFSLFQNHELDKFKCYVNLFSPQLNEERQLYVLINDIDNAELRDYCSRMTVYIQIFCVNRNLGVASGRNFLLKKAIEDGAQLFISCDSDILYENDYLDKVEQNYNLLKSKYSNLGLLQPMLLDGRYLKEELGIKDMSTWEEVAKRKVRFVGDDIRALLSAKQDSAIQKTIYHTGITNIYKAHYAQNNLVFPTTPCMGDFEDSYSYKTSVEKLRSFLSIDEQAPVSTTAGGISIFDIDLVERIGFYDDKFDPFLYEDSEYGFRAYKAELKSFLLPNIIAVHDVFMGESNRHLMQLSAIGKLRGVELAQKNLEENERRYMLSHSLIYCWKQFSVALSAGTRLLGIDGKSKVFSDQFIVNYILSFFFGRYSKTDQFINCEPKNSFFRKIFEKLDLGKGVISSSIPVSKNLNFVIGSLERRDEIESKVNLAVRGMNCRFENIESGKQSKYFDFYLVISNIDDYKYLLEFNTQAFDLTNSFKVEINIADWIDSPYKTGIDFHLKETKSKRYDYGSFSVEDIYPKATLTSTDDAVKQFVAQISLFEKATGSKLCKWLTKAVDNYFEAPKEEPQSVIIKNKPVGKTNVVRAGNGKKKLLIFTDSRGQHKAQGCEHDIFAERLAKDPRFEVDVFLCPLKWTTTLDFFKFIENKDLAQYDHIILFTGIVEWSPRPQQSAINDLYDNKNEQNIDNWGLNTRNYSQKIINNKKSIFDDILGETKIKRHLNSPFPEKYEEQKTINMYSLTLALEEVIPRLNKIDNLIFINANRFVDGWNGDFKRGRPKNIAITHRYADLFARFIDSNKLLDLTGWTSDDVKRFTCDNIHLTEAGSDYIFDSLLSMMKMDNGTSIEISEALINSISKDYQELIPPKPVERVLGNKANQFLKNYTTEPYIATLIVGVMFEEENEERVNNLNLLVKWIDGHWGNLFKILFVEQGNNPKFHELGIYQRKVDEYVFLYNPQYYNRGWGYNVAVKHYCNQDKVVVLMDTDVLPGNNFLADIRDCFVGKYDFISPYQNVYYTDHEERRKIEESFSLEHLIDQQKLKNPVTITGGILIANVSSYLSCKGFEQYMGYGCEDRSFDTTILNHCDQRKIKISNHVYAHLFHKSDLKARANFDSIYSHLTQNYGCRSQPKLTPTSFIHDGCVHSSKEKTLELMIQRATDFGNKDLYLNSDIAINGVLNGAAQKPRIEVLLPPENVNLSNYKKAELYKAPEPCTKELERFRNAFLGKRCFIIGNGPSLNKHDLSLIENEYTFGVNSFYYKTRETGFRPFFYVVEDSSVMKENIDEIRNYYAPFKFFPTVYKGIHAKEPNTFFFEMNRGFYEKTSPNYAVPRFSTDATKELFCGQSVTYINLQLAYFMGFTEVYLIGMDFSYVIPESHSRTGDVLLSDTDDENHFHKDYFGKGKTWKDPKLERVGNNYKMAKVVYESVGRKIYNATVGGSLEIFDRVDYDGLFGTEIIKNKESKVTLHKNTFCEANKLFQAKRYSDALVQYIKLVEAVPEFSIYKEAALNCYLKAKQNKQPIQSEVKAKVIAIL